MCLVIFFINLVDYKNVFGMVIISFMKIKGKVLFFSYIVDYCFIKYSMYKYYDFESNLSIIK